MLQEYTDSKATTETIASLRHIKTISDKMLPDPKEWSYEGECSYVEAPAPPASCACGHSIRNVFTIRRNRDGATLNIGSVCIESTVPYLIANGAGELAENLRSALKKMEEDRKEHAKRLREQRDNTELQAVEAEFDDLIEFFHHLRDGYSRYLPYYLYHNPQLPKVLSTPKRTISSIVRCHTKLWWNLWYNHVKGFDFRGRQYSECPPFPSHPLLVAALKKEASHGGSSCSEEFKTRYCSDVSA